MTTPTITQTRESWLMAAVEAFRPRFIEVGMPLPERVHVSVGFGFGTAAESANILGQCWAQRASADSVNHLFVSPEIGDTAKVLAVLLHELIHAADDCTSGHKGPFAEAAVRFGFEGSLLTLNPSVPLMAEMMTLAETLGEYPHGALTAASRKRARTPELTPAGTPGGRISSGPGTQTTRMLKLECPCCGYTVRTTAKWLAVGVPSCPSGTQMIQA